MSVVVDTSAIISVITNEKTKPKLIRMTEGEDLVAPSSLNWEIGNAISAMFKRNRISLKKAKDAIGYYQMIPLRLIDVDLKKSIEISHLHNIYAYDAYFLECARNFNSDLITLDNGLITVAEKMNINVRKV